LSSPYQCPRHAVPLVARVLGYYNRRHKFVQVSYFVCPVAGCNFKKPDKWAKRKRYGKND